MGIDNEEFIFNNGLCARTRELRERLSWTAEQMALALGIPAPRYRKYETRSPLPAYLMPKFVLFTNSDFDFLIGGERKARQKPVVIENKQKRA